jgi:hypothetical protein
MQGNPTGNTHTTEQPPLVRTASSWIKSKVFLFIILGIFILAIVSIIYISGAKKNQDIPIQSSTTKIISPSYADLYDASSSGTLNPDFEDTYNNIVKPFYEARIQGDKQTALSYVDYIDSNERYNNVYSHQPSEETGWKFVDPSFQEFQIIYGGIKLSGIENFVIRINKIDKTSQDEIVMVRDRTGLGSLSPKIGPIDFSPSGYSVLKYKNEPYLVLKTIEGSDPTKQHILLASKYFKNDCINNTRQNNCNISIFIQIRNSPKYLYLKDIPNFNYSSDQLRWSPVDPYGLVYEQNDNSSNTGGSNFSFSSINVNDGNITKLVTLFINGTGTIDIPRISSVLKSINECHYSAYSQHSRYARVGYMRINKNQDLLEFFTCEDINYSPSVLPPYQLSSTNHHFYLAFNQKLIKQLIAPSEKGYETVSDMEGDAFTFNIDENIFNIGQIKFKSYGVIYMLDTGTGKLRVAK